MGLIRRLIQWLTTPSSRFALGTLLLGGAVLGVAGWVSFDTVMHETSTDAFCSSCHEIRDHAAAEYVGTVHYGNEVGFHANCRDCHIPRPFVPRMIRKFQSLNELYNHVLGTLDTPEKYEAHRMRMATSVWANMKETDSRECRDCHDTGKWILAEQGEKARRYHTAALSNGMTCIDCHKGIAHELPAGIREDHQIEGIDH